MFNTVSLLQEGVGRHHIFRIIISLDTFRAVIFPVLSLFTSRDGIRHLNVGIGPLSVPQNEIAFRIPDLADTDLSSCGCIISLLSYYAPTNASLIYGFSQMTGTAAYRMIRYPRRRLPRFFFYKPIDSFHDLCYTLCAI